MKTLFPLVFRLIIIIIFTSCTNDDQADSENSSLNEWTKQADIPNSGLRLSANVITYDGEAYLLPGKGGTRFSSKPEILKYSTNEWTQIEIYDGFATAGSSISFRNNDVIYILGGVNGSNAPTEEVRAFSITNNTFSDETRFSSAVSSNTTYTESKLYFGNNDEFSSFDFVTNSTESLPTIPSNESFFSAILTTEDNFIYALFPSGSENNFFAFNQDLKQWIQLPDFPGGVRFGAFMVSTKTGIYTGLGNNLLSLLDIWKYDIETRKWIMFSEYPGKDFTAGFAFELNNQLFLGGGYTGGGVISNDVLNNEVYSIKVE